MKQSVVLICLFLGAVVTLLWTSSTFNTQTDPQQQMISESIHISAPLADVFRYLGNSDHAKDWSVYVDHISVLNPDVVSDGLPGSIRRCYVNSDETGIQWDEEILRVLPDSLRTLSVYNLKGFNLTAEGLVTDQTYQQLSDGSTMLSFRLHYGEHAPTLFELIKTHLASSKISRIFKQNLQNIKILMEEQKVGHYTEVVEQASI